MFRGNLLASSSYMLRSRCFDVTKDWLRTTPSSHHGKVADYQHTISTMQSGFKESPPDSTDLEGLRPFKLSNLFMFGFERGQVRLLGPVLGLTLGQWRNIPAQWTLLVVGRQLECLRLLPNSNRNDNRVRGDLKSM